MITRADVGILRGGGWMDVMRDGCREGEGAVADVRWPYEAIAVPSSKPTADRLLLLAARPIGVGRPAS